MYLVAVCSFFLGGGIGAFALALVRGGSTSAFRWLTDSQIIERCATAGIRWLPPEPADGFPGAFELVEMDEMRRLLSGLTVASAAQTQAARDVLAERLRQMDENGWTNEHDDQNPDGDMALAAACYAANAGGVPWSGNAPSFWPWSTEWWKPSTPRRDLEKAGALILAEIERIDRASDKAFTGDQP